MISCRIAPVWAHVGDLDLRGDSFHLARTGGMRPCSKNVFGIVHMSERLHQNVDWVNTDPIICELKALAPIPLELASCTELEPVWDGLVSRYHYLGYRNLLGHRLKYLAFVDDRPVAALSWSAPALKLRVRDDFIGWSDEQRKHYLRRVASNSRFLIFPWVHVPHLASHILSRAIRRLPEDWERHFDCRLWLFETFIDPQRFGGTSYKAANWIFLGHTYGSSKQGRGYVYHGAPKEVYVYVLEAHLRKHIGCEQKPRGLSQRPPLTKMVEELRMILRHADWNPDVMPCMDFTEKDLDILADELVDFHKKFHGCFGRAEHQRLGLAYISGLLSNNKAKSAEPIALEFLNQESVRSLQRFMKTYRWNYQAMEASHQSMLSQAISAPDGMINTDSSEFLKKGKESVGVARQYCGRAGKTDNCQSGVFVGYSSRKGYGLLTSQLYMPKIWFSEEYATRRQDNLVPLDLIFQTKPEIALNLIKKIVKSGLFPAKWIGCDATFGSDIGFLKSIPQGIYYFAAIRSNTQVFLEKPLVGVPPYQGRGPRPKRVQVLPGEPEVTQVSEIARSEHIEWTDTILAEGAKGPIMAKVAALRVYPSRNGLPEDSSCWLFMRRTPDGQMKYAISNAPEDMPFSELCEAATMRWPIEQCFEEGKSHLGMGDYEHRSWPAWHRHMIYVFLALHFLLGLRLKYKKNSCTDSASGAASDRSGIADGIVKKPKLRSTNRSVSYHKELCGI